MQGTKSVAVQVGRATITLESGLLAKQASGAVSARLGDTIVFSATTLSKKPRPGIDWFPLQVEYREKFYAAGRFPGGYFKREARPSEKEILTARATDRPIRPLFPKGFNLDVQIYNTLLSSDGINDSDILCMNAASASLTLSEAPFMGPIGAVRIGRVSGEFLVNPTNEEMDKSDLNLIYVSTRDLPVMIEGDAQEISEADMVAAMKMAHQETVKLIDAQLELRRAMGLPDKLIEEPEDDKVLYHKIAAVAGDKLKAILVTADKKARETGFDQIKEETLASLLEEDPELDERAFATAFDDLEIDIVRANVLNEKRRIDGRAMHDLRAISGQVGVLPRTHGSSVFTRGETQALATVTLGTKSDAQSMDAITGGPDEKNFMLHYNFPPYSVGEAGRIMGPGRREIGHGNLAERSLRQIMPHEYPYTVRVVSEIMESNGSSSMASICAGTLALMDAGVPVSKPVAGISIGLFTGEGKAELVTDILGSEDHCGDMDFKVAGTRDGITGFQVDLKLRGLAWDLVEQAFAAAHNARLKILDKMAEVIAEPRPDIAAHAPRVQVLTIPTDKIGALIGPGGKNIRRITDLHDVQIDIEDDGTVHIFATNKDNMDAAVLEVEALTKEAEIGTIYKGTVKSVKDFGAFVEILPGKEGRLVHISEMANFRVRAVEDICKVGDEMWVKCIDIDNTGRIRLSRKAALEDMDEGGDDEGGDD